MTTHLRTETIHRRDNGTIDFDFYRRRALSERRAAMRAVFGPARQMIRPVIVIAILVLMVWAISPLRLAADTGTLFASNAQRSVAR